MAYKVRPGDPRPVNSELFVSEQVELIFSDEVQAPLHQTAVNDFLISLREDENHVCIIRSVKTEMSSRQPNDDFVYLTAIYYTLIGTTDLPYLPS